MNALQQRKPPVHEPQAPGACFEPPPALFGKELISYLVRITISAGFGTLGALCERTDGRSFISIVKKYTNMAQLDAAILREFVEQIRASGTCTKAE